MAGEGGRLGLVFEVTKEVAGAEGGQVQSQSVTRSGEIGIPPPN